jgi:cbb3-type cytochrome oxidase subunit 3
MSLADIMSAADLHGWAEIGLVLFFALFLGVLGYVFSRRNRATFERASRMPLDDGPVQAEVQENSRHERR